MTQPKIERLLLPTLTIAKLDEVKVCARSAELTPEGVHPCHHLLIDICSSVRTHLIKQRSWM